jgi:hypothetical protein
LKARIASLLVNEEPMVVAGDFNVIPTPDDVYNPAAWVDDALFRPETRAHFQALLNIGLTDAFRACHDDKQRYTFWDYQAGPATIRAYASIICCCRRKRGPAGRCEIDPTRGGEAVGPYAGDHREARYLGRCLTHHLIRKVCNFSGPCSSADRRPG